tara:strand:+ start:177 stop:557 length:381 start_codon:yes stop_codon:yes gene_type:complete
MKKLVIIDDFAKKDPIEIEEFFDSLMMTEVVYYDEEGGGHVFPADVFMKTRFEELSYHNESSFQKLEGPLEYYYNEKGYYWVLGNNVEKNKNKNKILEKILCFLKKINIKSVYNKSNVIKFKKKKN